MLTGGSRPNSFHKFGRSGFRAVGVISSMQPVEDKHGGYHVLDAMVTVGEVVHRFVLFVDDADAGFVSANDDGFDVFGCLAFLLESDVDLFGGFDGGLRVKFSWCCNEHRVYPGERRYLQGYDTLKRMFSMT